MRHASSTARPNPATNSEQNDDIPHFRFSEEPLGLPASEGYGYFQGKSKVSLGPGGRFKLQNKLGFGTASSVWLARDRVQNTYVAIKILTGYATRLNHEHKLRELEVLQRLASPDSGPSSHCAQLLTHFIHPGIDREDGEHLCLVTELFSANVQDVQASLPDGFIPIPTLKKILKDILRGIAHLHQYGIAHTGTPETRQLHDRFKPPRTTEDIDTWVKANRPLVYAPERTLNNKLVSAFVLQSFPPPTLEQLASAKFKLADFSNAQFISEQTTDNITPLSLRPPEIILGGTWNESVDSWTFGCLIFTLLTNRALFHLMPSPEYDASEIDVLLYQMISFCGEFFKADFLQRCSRSIDFFQLDCRPKKFKRFSRKPFKKCILDSGRTLSSEDMEGVVDLMSKCLRINPKNRASAMALVGHPWLVV